MEPDAGTPDTDPLFTLVEDAEGCLAHAACWQCGTPLAGVYCPYCDISWIYDPRKTKGLTR